MRGRFIQESMEIQEVFKFAHPNQILRAIDVYCGHFYGLLLANLFSEAANKYYNSYSTAIKIAWKVPRGCRTYFIHNLLASENIPVKFRIMSRYVKFFQQLRQSRSREICVAANIVARDVQSTTGYNLAMIQRETNLCPWSVAPSMIMSAFQPVQPPNEDKWRIPYLEKLLVERNELETNVQDTKWIDTLIESICIN